MDVRFPTCVPLVVCLSLVSAALAGCNREAPTPTSPAAAGGGDAAITAEPSTVDPEFLHPSTCPGEPTFGFRLNVLIGHRRDLVLRGLNFRLVNAYGTSLPEVIPLSSSSPVPIPSTLPGSVLGSATLPSSPITFPSGSPTNGLFVAAGRSERLPYYLRFGCGVVPRGTLFIDADTMDGSGVRYPSHLRVHVGR